MLREKTLLDDEMRSNRLRIVNDGGRGLVYFETHGNHDGVAVHTTVRVERAVLVQVLGALGVLP